MRRLSPRESLLIDLRSPAGRRGDDYTCRHASAKKSPVAWAAWLLTILVLLWSGLAPKDRGTWFMEVAPYSSYFALVALTRRRFPLTTLLTVVITARRGADGGRQIHVCRKCRCSTGYATSSTFRAITMIRVGHFMQGFAPALVARELLLHPRHCVPASGWPWWWCSVALGISALYGADRVGRCDGAGRRRRRLLATQETSGIRRKRHGHGGRGRHRRALLLFSRWRDRQLTTVGVR